MSSFTNRRNAIKVIGASALSASSFAPALAQSRPTEAVLASILPLSGGFAQYGRELARGVEIGVEAVNRKGLVVGGKPFRISLKSYDDKTDATTAARLVERAALVDGANFLMAGAGSGIARSIIPVAQRLRVPVLSQWTTLDSVYLGQKGDSYFFGAMAPFSRVYDPIWEELPKLNNPKVQTVVMVSPNDELGGFMARQVPLGVQKADLRHLHTELFPPTSQDMSATVQRCAEHKPDVLLINCYTPQIISLFKQMQAVRFFPPVIIVEAPTKLYEALSSDVNGLYSPSFWHGSVSTTKDPYMGTSADFTAAYRAKFGEAPPDFVAACGAANVIVFAHVAVAAGTVSDQAALLSAFRSFKGETFFGPLEFSKDGMNYKGNVYADQFQNNQLKLVFPRSLAEAALVHPYPKSKSA